MLKNWGNRKFYNIQIGTFLLSLQPAGRFVIGFEPVPRFVQKNEEEIIEMQINSFVKSSQEGFQLSL